MGSLPKSYSVSRSELHFHKTDHRHWTSRGLLLGDFEVEQRAILVCVVEIKL